MSEHEVPGQAGVDSCDYEREFYTVMEEGLAGEKLGQFIFDAAEGDQARVLPDGRVAILLLADREPAERIVVALNHWQDHACQWSIETAMFLLLLLGVHLGGLDL